MASKFLRRRSMRLLMGQSAGGADLQVAIDDTRALREREKERISAENDASESQLRWAFSDAQRTGGSRALQEILACMHELQSLVGPVSEEYLESLHVLAKAYKDLQDQERQVERTRRNAATSELKARKLQAEAEKRRAKLTTGTPDSVSPSANENETRCTELRAQQAREASLAAQRSLNQAARDSAYSKLVRIRSTLNRVCDARLAVLARQQILVEAQKALLALLPDADAFADAADSSEICEGPRARKTLPTSTKNVAREIVSRTRTALLPRATANAQDDASLSSLLKLLRESTVSIASTPAPSATPFTSFVCTDSPANASRTTNGTSGERSLLRTKQVNPLNAESDDTFCDPARVNYAKRPQRSVLNLNVTEAPYQSQVVRSAGRTIQRSMLVLPSAPFASASASPANWPSEQPRLLAQGEEDRVEQVSMRQSTLNVPQGNEPNWRPTFVDSPSFAQPRTAMEYDDAFDVRCEQERYVSQSAIVSNDGYCVVPGDYAQTVSGGSGTPC